MKYVILISYFSTVFFTFGGLAQSVRNIDAEFDNQRGVINIYYDLKGYESYDKYEVKASFSQDNGKTFKPITGAFGDIGSNQTPGNRKKIRWDYYIDYPEFTGDYVRFKVEAKWNRKAGLAYLREFGQTGSAVYSAIVPGWGHYRVSKEHKFWWTTAAIYTVIGVGAGLKIAGNDRYKDYKNAPDSETADQFLQQANQRKQYGNILLGAGGAMWLSNVLWVAIKGKKNKKVYDFYSNPVNKEVGVNLNLKF